MANYDYSHLLFNKYETRMYNPQLFKQIQFGDATTDVATLFYYTVVINQFVRHFGDVFILLTKKVTSAVLH